MPKPLLKYNEADAMDEVLSTGRSLFDDIAEQTERPEVRAWSTPIDEIFANDRSRLDATHYDPAVSEIQQALATSGYELVPLSALATVYLRKPFTRIWAKDAQHGYKYLNATDLLSLTALGNPGANQRYLSFASETNLDALLIEDGWLLMTCSGTIGRVFYVPERLDGWAATHDLIRIVANDSKMTGFLMAWLNSAAAQGQILSHTHGGQIDHVTDTQVGSILVPLLPDKVVRHISTATIAALQQREDAMQSLLSIFQETNNVLDTR